MKIKQIERLQSGLFHRKRKRLLSTPSVLLLNLISFLLLLLVAFLSLWQLLKEASQQGQRRLPEMKLEGPSINDDNTSAAYFSQIKITDWQLSIGFEKKQTSNEQTFEKKGSKDSLKEISLSHKNCSITERPKQTRNDNNGKDDDKFETLKICRGEESIEDRWSLKNSPLKVHTSCWLTFYRLYEEIFNLNSILTEALKSNSFVLLVQAVEQVDESLESSRAHGGKAPKRQQTFTDKPLEAHAVGCSTDSIANKPVGNHWPSQNSMDTTSRFSFQVGASESPEVVAWDSKATAEMRYRRESGRGSMREKTNSIAARRVVTRSTSAAQMANYNNTNNNHNDQQHGEWINNNSSNNNNNNNNNNSKSLDKQEISESGIGNHSAWDSFGMSGLINLETSMHGNSLDYQDPSEGGGFIVAGMGGNDVGSSGNGPQNNLELPDYNCYDYESPHQRASPSSSVKVIFISSYAFTFAFGTIGNALTLYAMYRKREKFSVVDIFIANLALSDIMFCVFAVPITPIYLLVQHHWRLGLGLCKLFAFTQCASVYISTFTMINIAYVRYKLIVHPHLASMTKCTAALLNLATWFVACLITLPYLWHIGLKPDGCADHVFCDEDWQGDDRFWFSWCTLGLQFLLPCASTSFFYQSVYWKLRKQRILRRQQALAQEAQLAQQQQEQQQQQLQLRSESLVNGTTSANSNSIYSCRLKHQRQQQRQVKSPSIQAELDSLGNERKKANQLRSFFQFHCQRNKSLDKAACGYFSASQTNTNHLGGSGMAGNDVEMTGNQGDSDIVVDYRSEFNNPISAHNKLNYSEDLLAASCQTMAQTESYGAATGAPNSSSIVNATTSPTQLHSTGSVSLDVNENGLKKKPSSKKWLQSSPKLSGPNQSIMLMRLRCQSLRDEQLISGATGGSPSSGRDTSLTSGRDTDSPVGLPTTGSGPSYRLPNSACSDSASQAASSGLASDKQQLTYMKQQTIETPHSNSNSNLILNSNSNSHASESNSTEARSITIGEIEVGRQFEANSLAAPPNPNRPDENRHEGRVEIEEEKQEREQNHGDEGKREGGEVEEVAGTGTIEHTNETFDHLQSADNRGQTFSIDLGSPSVMASTRNTSDSNQPTFRRQRNSLAACSSIITKVAVTAVSAASVQSTASVANLQSDVANQVRTNNRQQSFLFRNQRHHIRPNHHHHLHHLHHRRHHHLHHHPNNAAAALGDIFALREKRLREKDRRLSQTNRKLLFMVALFACSWLPLNTFNLIQEYWDEMVGWSYFKHCFFTVHIIASFSVCYNPLLYAWMSDNYRQELREILPKCIVTKFACFFN